MWITITAGVVLLLVIGAHIRRGRREDDADRVSVAWLEAFIRERREGSR